MAAQVIPFRNQRPSPLDYAPGVAPFDRSNPAHVRAWNTIWALAKSELEWAKRYDD